MREIKFRGKSTKFGEWVYGCLTLKTGSPRIAFYNSVGYWIEVEVISETISQYTNLKDKNGKEIYEGDIVEYNDFNSLRTGGHADDKIIVGKVIFSCGMWMVEENNCSHDLYEGLVNDEELGVIGNIYENHELLERA